MYVGTNSVDLRMVHKRQPSEPQSQVEPWKKRSQEAPGATEGVALTLTLPHRPTSCGRLRLGSYGGPMKCHCCCCTRRSAEPQEEQWQSKPTTATEQRAWNLCVFACHSNSNSSCLPTSFYQSPQIVLGLWYHTIGGVNSIRPTGIHSLASGEHGRS